MAGSVIRTVLDKAQKFLNANYELQKDTKKMVKELTTTLSQCEKAVKEVEKLAFINNRALADLLRMLKETVYDAEDVLVNIEAKSKKVQGKNKVWRFASSSLSVVGNIFVPADNLRSLNMILVQLNKLSTDIPIILNLVNIIENNKCHTREDTMPKETIGVPFQDEVFYGREDELKQILDIILGSELKSSKKGGHDLFVVPIVGMGGVGKTEFAKAVYCNPEVQKNFASKAWISVSNKLDVDVKSVMRKIYESLGFSSADLITLEDIFTKITSCICGVGKFLIVLDDMFEIIGYEWEFLYETLSHCVPGSVVLITTQNKVFANRVGTFAPIPLSTLDPSKFWELFKHFAFRNIVMPEEGKNTLKSKGIKIAEKLHGLPLAAKVIGLSTIVDVDSWDKFSRSEWWEITGIGSQILPTIGLGFNELDPCLQQCFAYCSLFPRNSLIEKDRLINMWIAQNFIQSDDNGVMMSLEDIGRQWFDELVEKYFFQHAGDNNSYVMHGLMHDLAVIVSSGECFYLGEGVGVYEIPGGVRHLAVDTNNLDVIKGIRQHKNLRSFLYFGRSQVEGMYSAINNTLSNLDSIRVLDLSNMHMEKELIPPPAIWNLQHLRFLDLSSTGIKLLTHSSIDLYHLQALYIQQCELLEVPRGLNKLINLRHLFADEETIARISDIGQLTNLQEGK